MELRDFHGQKISALGVGCSNFGKRIGADEVTAVVHSALDAGVNFFDIADVYGEGTAETLLGAALGHRRDQAVIATKFGHGTHAGEQGPAGGHPANVVRSAEASMRRLGTDRIDLFQLHEPDPLVPVAETLGALEDLVAAGKVRWIGCSNVTLEQLTQAQHAAAARGTAMFHTVQNEYSMLVRDAEHDVLPHCRQHGIGFIPYFPLASGLLTGKYRMDTRVPPGSRVARMKPDKLFRFFTPRALSLVDDLVKLGNEHGRDPLTYALSFLLAEPAVLSIISGAMSPLQVRQNVAALAAATQVSKEELAALRELSA